MVKTACVMCGRKDMLHRFPNNLKRCTKWLEQCNRMNLMDKGVKCLHQNYRLCKRHFKPWCFSSSVSKCLIRCAHPEIFNVPLMNFDELPVIDSENRKSDMSVSPHKETDNFSRRDEEIDILENVVVPASKNLKKQESHLVIYNNVTGLPLVTSTESKCLYEVLRNGQIQLTKEKYGLMKSSLKKTSKTGTNMSNSFMSDLQKIKNIFSTFNQKKCLFSNSEMARLCLVLVKCKKFSNTVGSFDEEFEGLVNELIYTFQHKFKNKGDHSTFDELVCDLMDS